MITEVTPVDFDTVPILPGVGVFIEPDAPAADEGPFTGGAMPTGGAVPAGGEMPPALGALEIEPAADG
jgi:hypothetical protein